MWLILERIHALISKNVVVREGGLYSNFDGIFIYNVPSRAFTLGVNFVIV